MIDKLINVETGEIVTILDTNVRSYNFSTGSPFGQDRIMVYGYSSKNRWVKIEIDSRWVPLELFNPDEYSNSKEELKPFGRSRLNLLGNNEYCDDAPRGFIEPLSDE